MLKRIICLLFLQLVVFTLKGQEIYFIETSYDGKDYNDKLTKVNDSSVEVLSTIETYGSGWEILEGKKVISSNIYYIIESEYPFNFQDTLYKNHSGSILNITANKKYCYFTEVKNEEYRFDSIQLKRINVYTKELKKVNLPDSLNFSDISLSPKGDKISFIHYSNNKDIDKQYSKSYFLVYDLNRNKIIVLDSAFRKNEEWFNQMDNGPLSSWIDNKNIAYYRKDKDSANGRIYKINICKREKKLELNVPENRTNCFAYFNNTYFFINNGNIIFSVDKNGFRKEWYKVKGKNYLQQSLVVK